MSRLARKPSPTGIHHIMVRGINRQRIFEDSHDYSRYIESMRLVQADNLITFLAYCCMPNHVHLLVEEGAESISVTMKRLGVRYVSWFNQKYDRVGHLFQDRSASRPVHDDAYFATVLMYIHFNPVVAGLSSRPEEYPWSSRRDLGQPYSLVSTHRLMQLISLDAIHQAEEHYEPAVPIDVLGLDPGSDTTTRTDQDAMNILSHICQTTSGSDFQRLPRPEQKAGVSGLLRDGYTIRQISRVTGLSRSLIGRWRQEV